MVFDVISATMVDGFCGKNTQHNIILLGKNDVVDRQCIRIVHIFCVRVGFCGRKCPMCSPEACYAGCK